MRIKELCWQNCPRLGFFVVVFKKDNGFQLLNVDLLTLQVCFFPEIRLSEQDCSISTLCFSLFCILNSKKHLHKYILMQGAAKLQWSLRLCLQIGRRRGFTSMSPNQTSSVSLSKKHHPFALTQHPGTLETLEFPTEQKSHFLSQHWGVRQECFGWCTSFHVYRA